VVHVHSLLVSLAAAAAAAERKKY